MSIDNGSKVIKTGCKIYTSWIILYLKNKNVRPASLIRQNVECGALKRADFNNIFARTVIRTTKNTNALKFISSRTRV